jgi:hypothetical protein
MSDSKRSRVHWLQSLRWLRSPRALASFVVASSLLAAILLAAHGARTDSLTVDEPSHLIAGYAALTQGDYRLSPDHPPLARALLALPLLAHDVDWRVDEPEHRAAWRSGDFLSLGRDFLESWNDGHALGLASRGVAILGLVSLLVVIALVARERFGLAGAAVATTVAAFDPTLLAHGHFATIDVPFALAALCTLWTADRWLARPNIGRFTLFAVAFAAATLTKFSWFTLVPALFVMALVAVATRGSGRRDEARISWRTLAVAGVALAVTSIFAIWAAYGFRFEAARGDQTATMYALGDQGRARPTTPAEAWETVFHDAATAADRRGLSVPLLRFARDTKLLPEAYLYGVAFVAKKGLSRASYLRGEYSTQGFASYFPWAFAIKTPLPTLALYSLGLVVCLGAAFGAQRKERRFSPFAWGALVFALAYLATLAGSALNLGVRHLLPITPLLAIAVGGAWPRADRDGTPQRLATPRRVLITILLVGLAAETISKAPFHLGYFNQIVGGWRNGHLHLADSNLDWGQDLLRLEQRLDARPEPLVWLAQAGDPPLPRGLPSGASAEAKGLFWLFGTQSAGGKSGHPTHPAPIAGGLYVISATELLGVYRPLARAETWRDPRQIARFEQLAEQHATTARLRRLGEQHDEIDAFEALRRLRLIARLSQREPDERIGTSLFLFRLSDDQVAEMTRP